MLKVQELNNFTRSTGSNSKIVDVELSNTEKQIITKNGTLIAFGNQLAECQSKNCSQLGSLKTQYRQLTAEFNKLVEKIQNSEVDKSRLYNVEKLSKDLIDSADKIVDAQPDTVVIYPIVLNDKVRILWAGKGGVFGSKICNIAESQLIKDVSDYRELLLDLSSNITEVQAASKKLYDCLVKPLEAELITNKIKHLVFAPDRAINYIPMATLFDGQKYLIENYTVTSILSAGLTNVTDRLPSQVQKTQVLGLGLSNQATTPDGTFSALSNVPLELDAIVKQPNDAKGIYPGSKLLNQAFNRDALENNLNGRNILHIATHGFFKAKDPKRSYILLGTGEEYPIEQIQFLRNLRGVHLVVLSACETALGGLDQNGIEIQGISSYFLRDKAKAVIASLWVVSDRSTSALMQHLYTNLAQNKQPTKAEALRLAQLSLLYGKQVTLDGLKRGIFHQEIIPDKRYRQTATQASFAHPYYWAPFILIGNGL